MNTKSIEFYLKLKENINVELKKSQSSLPKSLWETYSSFANTCGGTIYLGIEEGTKNNTILGIKDPDKLKKEFFTTLNNSQKINKNILKEKDFKIVTLENGETIIEINVPEASIYDKPIYLNDNIFNSYKRNHEGDFKLNQYELLKMLDDAKVQSVDSLNNKLDLGFECVDLATLKSFRQDFDESNINNIFKDEADEQFLIKTGYLNLNDNNKYVLTNAGILLFTSVNYIKRINASYFLDYQEKQNDEDDYWTNRITTDDMDFVGNLYNFYKRVLDRLLLNLPKPFYLSGVKDTGEESIKFIIREAFLNAITNSDFNGRNALKIVKTDEKIIFKNSGKLRIPYQEAIIYGNIDPRNKSLMTTFRNLKVCDREGTGLPRIFKLSKALNLYDPILIEDNILDETKLTIYLKFNKEPKTDASSKIIDYLRENDEFISISDLSNAINLNRTTVSIIVNLLIEDDILITNGLATKGKKIKIK